MRRAFKRYLIAKAPEMLVFHLKRFKQSTKTGLTFTSFYDLKK
jgi:ubiquitin carboxyl-terminal hydrolase 16/45